MRPFLTLLSLATLLFPVHERDAAAQDPFDFGAPAGQAAAAETDSETAGPAGSDEESPASAPDPLVTQLVENARRGPRSLAKSIASLARIDAWDDVDRLLQDASGREYDDGTRAEMAELIGPALLVRLGTRESISAASRDFLSSLEDAYRANRENPERLSHAVDRLAEGSVDATLGAFRSLLEGGHASIELIVNRLVTDANLEARDKLLLVLRRLGPGGRRALEQLALYGRLPERARAVESLAALAAGESIPMLATTMHAADASDRERGAAAEALRRLAGGVGSRDDAIDMLATELRRTMRSAAQRDNDGAAVTLWSVGPERRSIRPTESYAIVRGYRDGFDHAAQLRRVGEWPADVAREALIADLSYRVLVDPDWGSPDQRQAVRQAYGAISDAESVARALDEAMQRDNSLASIGLLRMVTDKGGQAAARTLLAGRPGVTTPLVRATRFGDPRVRYEAVAAIDRLSPEDSYPGIGRVKRTVDEMRELAEGPTVVLAETRGDLIRRLESILSGFGLRVDVVGSGRALERRLARGGDLRMVVASTELNDFRPTELVDRVRRSPISNQLPIVFYGDDLPEAVGDRWPGITASIQPPVSTAAFAPILLEMRRSRRLPEISAADRYHFRTLAESFGGAEG